MADKYLIVGLGNPGREYAMTRHNVGFWVIDELSQRHGMSAFKSERKALVADGTIKGKRVILAKPQTYMNLSGESVQSLINFYKITPAQLIVAHDDLDLPLGTLRLRKTGSHGGQNGMRNIILHLGTQDFARVRFGIGRPPGKMQAKDHVLNKFIGDDEILAKQVVDAAANAIEHWLEEGIELAMSRYNGDVKEEGSKPHSPTNVKDQLAVVERAHQLNPNDPKPLEQMAILYKKLRRLEDAFQAHLNLADVYETQGEHKKAMFERENAVKIQPEQVAVREAMALRYEALDDAKRASQTWLKLAEFHDDRQATDSALRALKEVLRLNPQHPKASVLQLELQKKLVM